MEYYDIAKALSNEEPDLFSHNKMVYWRNKPSIIKLRTDTLKNNQDDWQKLKTDLDTNHPGWDVKKKTISAGKFRKLLSPILQLKLDKAALSDDVARTIVSYAQTYDADITFGSEITAGMVMYLAGQIPIKGTYMPNPILTPQQAKDWLAWKKVS